MPDPLPSNEDTSLESKEIGKDGILDILNDDTDDTDDGEKLDIETSDEEKEDEEKEGQEEKEGESEEEIKLSDSEEDLDDDDDSERADDEELELTTPVRRKEILAKYPKLFKDFPYLEKAYYREQQYTEIFPTVEDAQTAVEVAQAYQEYEGALMSGDIASVLGAVKEQDPESFNKIVDGMLSSIGQVDQQASYHMVGNIIKNTVVSMAQEAQRLGPEAGKQLNAAAQLVNQFIFGTSQFQPITNLFDGKERDTTEEDELEEQRVEFATEQFQTVFEDMTTRVGNTLRSTINEHIDPKGSMSDYVKRNAIREAQEDLEERMSSDQRFSRIMDDLWRRSAEQNFSQVSTRKIRSVYLSKAKTVLPAVIKKARRAALKGTGRKVTDGETGQSPRSRRTSTRQSPISGKRSEDGRGMSTLDFFNQD